MYSQSKYNSRITWHVPERQLDPNETITQKIWNRDYTPPPFLYRALRHRHRHFIYDDVKNR